MPNMIETGNKKNSINFEVCTDSFEGALAAAKYGAKRIELCQALSVGGLTPNYGLIKECADNASVEVHVMIRHKEGGFVYDDADVDIMKKDIRAAKKAGAKGVVFGILDVEYKVSEKNKILANWAKDFDLEVTFHRAFDFVKDPFESLEKIILYGFDRLLTSGKKETAFEGLDLIAQLQEKYGNRIQIMAGSGVNKDNAVQIASTGIKNLHFTARKSKNLKIDLSMGELMITDEDKIRDIIERFNL